MSVWIQRNYMDSCINNASFKLLAVHSFEGQVRPGPDKPVVPNAENRLVAEPVT